MHTRYQYSIIIPHKNIPSLLRRCLHSIPCRDDIQIIIVDDNSDGGKVDFEKFPGLNEKNTEVYFTKEGKGAGYARNVGLKYATGKWVLFADADDMFLPEIEKVFEYVENTLVDIVFFRSKALNSKDLSPVVEYNFTDRLNELYCECKDNLDKIRGLTQVPWGKVIRRSLIESYNIQFEEILYANDIRFNAICDYYARSIDVCEIIAYCWLIRPKSLFHGNKRTMEWAKTRFKALIGVSKFYREVGDSRREEIFCIQAHNYLGNIDSKKEYVKCLISYIWYVGFFQFTKSWIKKRLK